jgi:hypothetical protein
VSEQITVEEALRRVEAVSVSRAAVMDAWPECHRAKCAGRHPSPDETFNMFMAKIREALRFPETNWRYKPEPEGDITDPDCTCGLPIAHDGHCR